VNILSIDFNYFGNDFARNLNYFGDISLLQIVMTVDGFIFYLKFLFHCFIKNHSLLEMKLIRFKTIILGLFSDTNSTFEFFEGK
jgi:hypothetical protein